MILTSQNFFRKEVKTLIKLCGLYIIVEFIDYITAVCCHIIMGDYKSHIAKVGAIKKFLLTVTIVALPLLTQLVNVVGNEIGVVIPPEIYKIVNNLDLGSIAGSEVRAAVRVSKTKTNKKVKKLILGDSTGHAL